MPRGRTIRDPSPGSRLRRGGKALAALGLLIIALVAPISAAPLKTTLTVTTTDGYARLVFSASEYIDASARQGDNVLIISFKEPIDVSVDRLPAQAPDYIGAARRDPDGKAVRIALDQSVTVHAIGAGEKYFVDLLPKSWTGAPPGLPPDVVEALVRHARDAEMLLQRDQAATQNRKVAPIRVHVATQPTFTRYVFGVPARTAVSADRNKDRLVLHFEQPLTFDLADARAALPTAVREISSELDQGSAAVQFILAAKVDTRTFRDESGYVVDVVKPTADPDAAVQPTDMPPGTPPQTVPAPSLAAAAAQISAAAAAPAMEVPPTPAPKPTPAPTPRVASPPAPSASAVPTAPAPVAAPPPTAPAPLAAAPPAPVKPSAAAAPTTAAASPSQAPAAAPMAKVVAAAKPVAAPVAMPPAVAVDKPVAPAVPATAPAKQPAVAAAASKPTVAAVSPAAAPNAGSDDHNKIVAELSEDGATMKLTFAFPAPVGIAVFHRADTLWIVFDSKTEIDLKGLDGEPSRTIRSYEFSHSGDADVVRLKLDRPHLSSVAAEGSVWTVNIGDAVLEPTRALEITRNMVGPNRSNVSIAFDAVQQVHRISDPDVGDKLYVVTALAPARGLIDEQDFVEFHALASTQGVAIEPLADDLSVNVVPDKIIVGRPGGLTLSASLQTLLHGSGLRPTMFNSQIWGSDLKELLLRSGNQAHRCRRRSAEARAPFAAARTDTILYRARHVSRGQRGARCRFAGRGQRRIERYGTGAALRRRDHDEPPRGCAQRSCRTRRRRSARCAVVARASLCARGQVGAGARSVQNHDRGGSDAAGRIAARRAQG